jgi:hypothetical protein
VTARPDRRSRRSLERRYVDQPEPLAPSGLNRTLKIVAVDRLDEVIDLIAPARASSRPPASRHRPTSCSGWPPARPGGVTRIAALGAMTAPEAGWHHDGRFNLLDLVTMTEIEQARSRGRGFAPYVD